MKIEQARFAEVSSYTFSGAVFNFRCLRFNENDQVQLARKLAAQKEAELRSELHKLQTEVYEEERALELAKQELAALQEKSIFS